MNNDYNQQIVDDIEDEGDYQEFLASLEELEDLESKAAGLMDAFERIHYKNSINQKEAIALEAAGVQFSSRAPIQSFTLQDSKTNLSIAMEGIFKSIVDVIKKIVQAIINFFKSFSKIVRRLIGWIRRTFTNDYTNIVFERRLVKNLTEGDKDWLRKRIEAIPPIVFLFISGDGLDFNKIDASDQLGELNAACNRELITLFRSVQRGLNSVEENKKSMYDLAHELPSIRDSFEKDFEKFRNQIDLEYLKIDRAGFLHYFLHSGLFHSDAINELRNIPKSKVGFYEVRDIPDVLLTLGTKFLHPNQINLDDGIRFKRRLLDNPDLFLKMDWAKAEKAEHVVKVAISVIENTLDKMEKEHREEIKEITKLFDQLEDKINHIQSETKDMYFLYRKFASSTISILNRSMAVRRRISSGTVSYYRGILRMGVESHKSIIRINNLMRELIDRQNGL